MTARNAIISMVLGSLMLGGCAATQDTILIEEGYHRQLKPLATSEASKMSSFLWNTNFSVPEASPLTCFMIVQAINSQMAKSNESLRFKFEFSKGSEGYFRPMLSKPLTTWYSKSVSEAQVKSKLAEANLSEVLGAIGEQ